MVTGCRGNRDLVSDGYNGYVVGIDNVEGFAKAVQRLYRSNELRKEFRSETLELVKQYSLDSVMVEIEQIYNSFLD